MSGRKRMIQRFTGIPLAVGLLLLVGCAPGNYRADFSGNIISQGEKAINEAKSSNATVNAAAELKVAEEKLSLAKGAFAKEEHDKAARLAEEAVVDAEYAQSKATAVKNVKTVEEMQKNKEVLRQEIDRQSK